MLDALGKLLAWPLLALVWLYRLAISPWLGANCRFDPTCSEYALQALREHGAFRGTWLAARTSACPARSSAGTGSSNQSGSNRSNRREPT